MAKRRKGTVFNLCPIQYKKRGGQLASIIMADDYKNVTGRLYLSYIHELAVNKKGCYLPHIGKVLLGDKESKNLWE